MTVSKTDSSNIFLGERKTQRVTPWSRDCVSRDASAILVVTRSTRDHVKSEMRVMHQCVSLLFI